MLAINGTFDDNRSVWLVGAAADAPAPALAQDIAVDVAIIGGGFTGVSTAYQMSRRMPHLGIALLEGRRLGNGASGRSGGMMLNGITVADGNLEDEVREHDLTHRAMDAIEALIAEHGLKVRLQRAGSVKVCTTNRAAEEAHARVEKLAALGLPLRFLARGKLDGLLRAQGVAGAVFDASEGVMNGVDLIRALRPLLVAQGVAIHEATPVLQVREGRTIELTTPGGTVRAGAIVLATNGYTPRLGYFRTGLLPVISHAIATDPLPPELLASAFGSATAFADDKPRLAYASVDGDGRIVFGGGTNHAYGYQFGNRTASNVSLNDAAGRALLRSLLAYFPGLGDVTVRHRWSGPLGLTLARHCAMGVRGSHNNIYYALGYSGHGVVLANLAGSVLADLYQGNHDPWRPYAFYNYRPLGIPTEPLRWLGYHAFTMATGHSPWKRLTAPVRMPQLGRGGGT